MRKSHEAREKLLRLGIFRQVDVLIDTCQGTCCGRVPSHPSSRITGFSRTGLGSWQPPESRLCARLREGRLALEMSSEPAWHRGVRRVPEEGARPGSCPLGSCRLHGNVLGEEEALRLRAQPQALLVACLLWQASGAGVVALLLEVPWAGVVFPGCLVTPIIPKIPEAVCVAGFCAPVPVMAEHHS